MNKLSRFLVVAIALSSFLVAFSQREIERHFSGKFLSDPMLKSGGVEEALPLSSFCSATKENDHSIQVDCGELPVCANVGIGDTFGVMDLIPASIDREELNWEMSVDGHPINLEAFGVDDVVYPDLAPHPSRVREVFKVERLWNVVLVNPTPGMHRVQGQAQSQDGAETYSWVVNFTVASSTLAACPLANPSSP